MVALFTTQWGSLVHKKLCSIAEGKRGDRGEERGRRGGAEEKGKGEG